MKLISHSAKWAMILCTAVAAFPGCTKSGDNSGQAVSQLGGRISDDPKEDRGIGPITSDIKLTAINPQMAAAGKALFKERCSGCHKIETKYVGPALAGVTQRQRPEWIMNMILNPAEMTQKDPTAKQLLATHFTQMTFQNVTQDDARKILEFFRQNDANLK